jgi:hypothetical protein
MFDAESLRELVSRCGFTDLEIFTYDIRNLRCYALRAPDWATPAIFAPTKSS